MTYICMGVKQGIMGGFHEIPARAKYHLVNPLLVCRSLIPARKKSEYLQELIREASQSICFMESYFLTQITDQLCLSLYPL